MGQMVKPTNGNVTENSVLIHFGSPSVSDAFSATVMLNYSTLFLLTTHKLCDILISTYNTYDGKRMET